MATKPLSCRPLKVALLIQPTTSLALRDCVGCDPEDAKQMASGTVLRALESR